MATNLGRGRPVTPNGPPIKATSPPTGPSPIVNSVERGKPTTNNSVQNGLGSSPVRPPVPERRPTQTQVTSPSVDTKVVRTSQVPKSDSDQSSIPPPPPNPPSDKATNNRNAKIDPAASVRKRGKMNIHEKAPLPMEFLKDANAKIAIAEANPDPNSKEKWYTITFEYATVLRSSEWSKPDKEGELLKPGSVMKQNWKTRWCIVQGSKFFCFKTKPMGKDDEPSISVELHGGSVVDAGYKNKYYCFEVVEADNVKRVTLAAKNKADYEAWLDKLQVATSYEGPVVEIVEQMKQAIAVQYSPDFGYLGFPIEWKQLLKDHAVTEKEFFTKPDEILNKLKFNNKTSQPIVKHDVTNTPVAIEDVVNKKGSPDMYTGFQLLGSGSFGEVYEAIHISTNQRVAIKKMLVTPRRLKLFISEINIQRSTQHPNVVKLIDAFPVDTHIWVVLEYMQNGNLTMVLDALKEAKASMTEPQIAYICLESLKSLSYVHSLHRIHRDIKSDNVLLGANGEIKLADFGYAVQLSGEDEKRQTVCGSPYWMAPEVIMGQQYGKEVDIWSLGIMLMECCDLEPPYILESPSKALVLLSTKPVPPLKNPEKWSNELKNFRDLCLNRDPKARPEAIELLQHPFLRRTCTPKEFKEQLLDKQKKKKDACLIQ